MASPEPVTSPDAAFEEFVASRSASLLRLALLLTGWNRAVAEDLTQIALERVYRRRRALFGSDTAQGAVEPYVRKILVNAAIDWRRGLRRRPEEPLDEALRANQADGSARLDDRIAEQDQLRRGLASLPPRQRAVLVLKYWQDLTDAEIASVLNCGVGTVKSQASRGLQRLRELTGAGPRSSPPGAKPATQPGVNPTLKPTVTPAVKSAAAGDLDE
ncbi:MAG TPA: SigE family RNA polymerase sigma factor [Streptosporangiaceae bacterium]|nr:SigE family RNA polymerase sigma factor [Streptosporangiaceae bacterium]